MTAAACDAMPASSITIVHLAEGRSLLCGARMRQAKTHWLNQRYYAQHGISPLTLLEGEAFCSDCVAEFRRARADTET